MDVLAIGGHRFGEGFALEEVWGATLDAISFEDGSVRTLAYDSNAAYALQPVDFTADGRADLLLTATTNDEVRRYFLTVSFASGVAEVHGVATDAPTLRGALPFVRSAEGAYFRGNWAGVRYRDSTNIFVEQVVDAEGTPPGAPIGVSAVEEGAGSLGLSWSPPNDADGQSLSYAVELERMDGAYRYHSEGARAFASNWTTSTKHRWDHSLNRTPRTEASFRDLKSGTYTVRVVAVDAAGRRGALSAPVTVVVASGPAPMVPEAVVAAPVTGGIAVTYRVRGVADSVGVYRRDVAAGEEAALFATVPVNETRYYDTDVVEGQRYEYSVETYLDGATSPRSEPASATAPGMSVVPVWLPYEGENLTGSLTYDLDADGYLDLVVRLIDPLSGVSRFAVVPGSETGFDADAALTIIETDEVMGEGWPFLIGDWDGDGDGDLITSTAVIEGGIGYGMETVVWTLDGFNSTGFLRYEAQAEDGTENGLGVIDVADFDLNGRVDVLLAAASGPSVMVGWSEPDGTVTFERVVTNGVNAWQVTRLDYDQDGRFDLLVPTTAGVPVLLHNEGGRTFATVPSGLGTGEYHEFNPVWLTDDPYPDLLVASGGKDPGWDVFAFDEALSTFVPHPLDVTAFSGENVWPVHLDTDGDIDFVQIRRSPRRIVLWFNSENAALEPMDVPLASDLYLLDAYNVDFDRDGVPDLLLHISGSDDGFLLVRGVSDTSGPLPPSAPTGIAASGDASELVISWTPDASGLAGYTAYGVVLESADRTVVVGEVDPEAGVARRVRGDMGVHGGSVRLRNVVPGAYAVRVATLDAAGHSSGLTPPLAVTITPVGVEEDTAMPRTRLHQSVPNPTAGSATVTFDLARASEVRLVVFDMLGREVVTLVEGRREAGRHEVTIQGEGLAPGVYFYRLAADGTSITRRMVVL